MTTNLQKTATFIIILLGLFMRTYGQTNKDKNIDAEINCVMKFDSSLNRTYYISVDKMPSYKGGPDTLVEVVKRNLQMNDKDVVVKGAVYISFIIEANGKQSSVKLLKSFIENKNVEQLAINRALKAIPRLTDWTPGQCNEKNVPVYLVQPIRFNVK